MEIRPLADVPESIPMLAEWFRAEWHRFDQRSRAEIEAQLCDNLNRDSLPISFVALFEHELAGTVSLDLVDLPGFDHLSPWLASLYVVPSGRRQGIGRMLVRHVITFGRDRGYLPIYLWTPGPTQLYETLGFNFLTSAEYSGQPITLMKLSFDANSRKYGT